MSLLRVMTFNVQGQWPKEGPNSWTDRTPLNVALLRRHAPDLIGFQEAQAGNLEVYREQLTGYAHVQGNCYGDNPPRECTSIFWKADRFDLLDSGEFWFSPTPDVASVGWGDGGPGIGVSEKGRGVLPLPSA